MTKELMFRMGKLNESAINRHMLFEVNVSGGYRAVSKIGAGRFYDLDDVNMTASSRVKNELLMDVLKDALTDIEVVSFELHSDSHLLNMGKKQDIVIQTIQGKKKEPFEMKGYIKYVGVYDFPL